MYQTALQDAAGTRLRAITADVNNQGTVNINVPTSFNKTSGTITNQGTFKIAAGVSFSSPTSGQPASMSCGPPTKSTEC